MTWQEEMRKCTTEEFVSKAKIVHRDTYDYSKADYLTAKTLLTIICREHGEFQQLPFNHLTGMGCPACGSNRAGKLARSNTEEFIIKAVEVHGSRYDYSSTAYKRRRDKVTITCEKHGPFQITPADHLRGRNCPICTKAEKGKKISIAKTKTPDRFAVKATAIHAGKYDYSRSMYTGVENKIEIECPVHGPFTQLPSNHLQGSGCIKCFVERNPTNQKSTTAEFVKKAAAVHGDKYDYTFSEYTGVHALLRVDCGKHGEFWQSPGNHLKGSGCPQCFTESTSSKAEQEIKEYIETLGVGTIISNDRRVIAPYELDVLLPDYGIAVEHCGLYWHRHSAQIERRYHTKKLDLCLANDIRLFTIFEDEWLYRKEAIKSLLKQSILKSKPTSIGARKTKVVELSNSEAEKYLNAWHIQGHTNSQITLALAVRGTVIAVAGFSKQRVFYGGKKKSGEYELVRFCESPETKVHGGLQKLIREFSSRAEDAAVLVSYVDRRLFTGASLEAAGFGLIRTSEPGYFYSKNTRRYSRFTFAKHLLQNKLSNFDQAKTEKENMLDNGYHIIYDCGQLVYRLGLR